MLPIDGLCVKTRDLSRQPLQVAVRNVGRLDALHRAAGDLHPELAGTVDEDFRDALVTQPFFERL